MLNFSLRYSAKMELLSMKCSKFNNTIVLSESHVYPTVYIFYIIRGESTHAMQKYGRFTMNWFKSHHTQIWCDFYRWYGDSSHNSHPLDCVLAPHSEGSDTSIYYTYLMLFAGIHITLLCCKTLQRASCRFSCTSGMRRADFLSLPSAQCSFSCTSACRTPQSDCTTYIILLWGYSWGCM